MQLSDRLLAEFTHEIATTRRVFDRIPEEKFPFRPHPKSMSLGQLALHIARVPGGVTQLVSVSPAQAPSFGTQPTPASRAELHAALDWSVDLFTKALAAWGDAGLNEEWRMVAGERTLLALPRFEMVRSTVLNHWYHHRGELMVYLRLLDVPLPSIYGPSADEDPFAR